MSLRDADPALLDRLAAALGAGAVRPPEPRHLEELRRRRHGRAAAVLTPTSTEAVSRAVTLCAEARVGIIPFAGGTGLVGGHTPEDGPLPVILSVERLTAIRETDPAGGILVAEAGAILSDVQSAARAANRLFPLSLASEGSARIGGLVGANAGGVNVLRYGVMRDLCLGVEAVLADGAILHGLRHVLKDNMGYDVARLLIGSEGTLGIVTAASLRLFPLPSDAATAWVPVASPAAALDLFAHLRDQLGQSLSAFELISGVGLAFLAETLPQVAQPFATPPAWSVLVELTDGPGAALGPRLEAALTEALETGLAADALIAQSESQRRAFWTVRETIPEANRAIGAISSHDLSVPIARIPAFLAEADAALAALDPSLRVNAFGHLGDGNLHYNVFPARGRAREAYDPIRATVQTTVHDLTMSCGGSIAAEHGVGRLKTADLARYADPTRLAVMRAIKTTLDPLGILNPGAVLAG